MSNEMDWSKAPKGADRIVQAGNSHQIRWGKGKLEVWYGDAGWLSVAACNWDVIANRPAEPERKTVKDAVEYYGGKWPVSKFPGDKFNYIYMKDDGSLIPLRGNHHGSSALVCTRAEFEAEVERQKGEEWTHTCSGDKCRVLIDKPDCDGYVVVLVDGLGYDLVRQGKPKPIKPKITQEQADSIIAAAAAWGVDADDCQDYLLKFSVTGHDESLEF